MSPTRAALVLWFAVIATVILFAPAPYHGLSAGLGLMLWPWIRQAVEHQENG